MATILVLHGPNLNLLGSREPDVYGADTLDSIHARLEAQARAAGHHLQTLQSNAEYELINRIQDARREGVDFAGVHRRGVRPAISVRVRHAGVRLRLIVISCVG